MDWIQQQFYCQVENYQAWSAFKHTFSHFHLLITPIIATVKPQAYGVMETPDSLWYNLNALEVAVPAPVRKILNLLRETI